MSSYLSSVFRQGLFYGRTAIVTGGATGIGNAIAKELLILGCNVVIASRDQEKLQKAESVLRKAFPKQVHAIQCNIRKEQEVKDLAQKVVENYGSIDYLVNNGGGQFMCPVSDMSLKGWNAVIETNLTGTFLMCQEVFKQSMQYTGGSIVNIILDMQRGRPMMGHSGAARAGVDNLTKTLAVEWAHLGIRVNSVAPISGAVCFLLSPAASYVTGTTNYVDGGRTLNNQAYWNVPEHQNMPVYNWEEENIFDSEKCYTKI